MKFLVDECAGNGLASWLAGQGYDTISVAQEMSGITDKEVLAKAYNEHRILITVDKDFGDMVFRFRFEHHGIVLIRLDDERPVSKIETIALLLKSYAQELQDNFVVVTKNNVRLITKK